MKTITFGNTGEQVSEICLGTMMFGNTCDQAESDRILSAALDADLTFVDTAAMYGDGGTEDLLGKIIGDRRDKIFLATKVHKGIDGESITTSIDESLRRLQTDRVDLYLIHWPKVGMDPEEVMQALHTVVTAGKARYIGCSNYSAWLFAHSNAIATKNGWTPLVNNQVPYNLVERGVEVEVLPQAAAENIAITVYRPLLMGVLSGKYRPGDAMPDGSRGVDDTRIGDWLSRFCDGVDGFLSMAEELGTHPAALATAWVKQSPGITCPIVGVSSLKQLETSLAATTLELSAEQHERLTGLFKAAAVQEECGGAFGPLRRERALLG